MRQHRMKRKYILISIIGGLVLGGAVYLVVYESPSSVASVLYQKNSGVKNEQTATALDGQESVPATSTTEVPAVSLPLTPTHVATPSRVKAMYVSAWIAGSKSNRDRLFELLDETEVNSIVIDVKDSTGRISFPVNDPMLAKEKTAQTRISDIVSLVNELHAKNIYVIGRIAVFQDPLFIERHPEVALKSKANPTELWHDTKKIGWIDAGSQIAWDYVIAIAHEAYADGFDEANFDYIRYPSDGKLSDISFPISAGKVRATVVNSFFEYVHEKLSGSGMKTSADIFGLTTTEKGDLGIGQVLENALRNFDYVAPMIYPSHFALGTYGIAKPAEKPYETIIYSMKHAVARAKAIGVDPLKLRPWLQDFNLGATYTKEMVRAEIQAVYDAHLDSWMMWDPANRYKSGGFLTDLETAGELDAIAPEPSPVVPVASSTPASSTTVH